MAWFSKGGIHSSSILVLAALVSPVHLCAADPSDAFLKYTLTIYVDEGHGDFVGHVFTELSAGKNDLYFGFYPSEVKEEALSKPVAAEYGFLYNGEIRNDEWKISKGEWDVKRRYNITRKN